MYVFAGAFCCNVLGLVVVVLWMRVVRGGGALRSKPTLLLGVLVLPPRDHRGGALGRSDGLAGSEFEAVEVVAAALEVVPDAIPARFGSEGCQASRFLVY